MGVGGKDSCDEPWHEPLVAVPDPIHPERGALNVVCWSDETVGDEVVVCSVGEVASAGITDSDGS